MQTLKQSTQSTQREQSNRVLLAFPREPREKCLGRVGERTSRRARRVRGEEHRTGRVPFDNYKSPASLYPFSQAPVSFGSIGAFSARGSPVGE